MLPYNLTFKSTKKDGLRVILWSFLFIIFTWIAYNFIVTFDTSKSSCLRKKLIQFKDPTIGFQWPRGKIIFVLKTTKFNFPFSDFETPPTRWKLYPYTLCFRYCLLLVNATQYGQVWASVWKHCNWYCTGFKILVFLSTYFMKNYENTKIYLRIYRVYFYMYTTKFFLLNNLKGSYSNVKLFSWK